MRGLRLLVGIGVLVLSSLNSWHCMKRIWQRIRSSSGTQKKHKPWTDYTDFILRYVDGILLEEFVVLWILGAIGRQTNLDDFDLRLECTWPSQLQARPVMVEDGMDRLQRWGHTQEQRFKYEQNPSGWKEPWPQMAKASWLLSRYESGLSSSNSDKMTGLCIWSTLAPSPANPRCFFHAPLLSQTNQNEKRLWFPLAECCENISGEKQISHRLINKSLLLPCPLLHCFWMMLAQLHLPFVWSPVGLFVIPNGSASGASRWCPST